MRLFSLGIRRCYSCKHFDGEHCRHPMKNCWKFNWLPDNKSCSTENFYFHDRDSGRYLFRYTILSCKPCVGGVTKLYHDFHRETFCCVNENLCNDGSANLDLGRVSLEEARLIADPPKVQEEPNYYE
ncbi:prostate and testis expressed protein 13-like [Cavia porcellus]|uniref:prostate and testis expressed protein 13-like n=1 Tax=Cavia porcellus TaxID=10141 RepID=UPI002FE03B3C